MRKLFKLLSVLIVLSLGCQVATYALKNPLASYDLYKDTHGGRSAQDDINDATDRFFGEDDEDLSFFEDDNIDNQATTNKTTPDSGQGRNEYLRQSSRQVFSNSETPAWTERPSFYSEPSFESIKAKYKKSDFAGCMQECESYVRLHPTDTLGYYYLAMCYTKVNDKENAIKAYERVIALNDNPMIVKYATNGRNCIMSGSEKCFQNVNEPEYIYPYRNVAGMDLTPVDTQTLIDRNLKVLKNQIAANANNKTNNDGDDKDKKGSKVKLPTFGTVQDAKLDEFIESPYGNGLSPDLNKEYTLQQLKKIQETINNGEDSLQKQQNEIKNIRDFDKKKSDIETGEKLAYNEQYIEALTKDPQFVQAQKEMNELRMLLDNDRTGTSSDLTDLIPYMSEQRRNLSPEVIQAMMLKSTSDMTNFNF